MTPWRQAHLLEQKEGLRDSLINCAALFDQALSCLGQTLALLMCEEVKETFVA